jgi:hypothetical protein
VLRLCEQPITVERRGDQGLECGQDALAQACRLRVVGVAVQLEPGHCAPVAVDQPDAEIVRGRGLVFRDSWGNLVEVVQYGAIQFSKTAGVLRGMGLGGIGKTAAAQREISEKGLS